LIALVIWRAEGVGVPQARDLSERCTKGENVVFLAKWFIL
jgi:hypothetical protein